MAGAGSGAVAESSHACRADAAPGKAWRMSSLLSWHVRSFAIDRRATTALVTFVGRQPIARAADHASRWYQPSVR